MPAKHTQRINWSSPLCTWAVNMLRTHRTQRCNHRQPSFSSPDTVLELPETPSYFMTIWDCMHDRCSSFLCCLYLVAFRKMTSSDDFRGSGCLWVEKSPTAWRWRRNSGKIDLGSWPCESVIWNPSDARRTEKDFTKPSWCWCFSAVWQKMSKKCACDQRRVFSCSVLMVNEQGLIPSECLADVTCPNAPALAGSWSPLLSVHVLKTGNISAKQTAVVLRPRLAERVYLLFCFHSHCLGLRNSVWTAKVVLINACCLSFHCTLDVLNKTRVTQHWSTTKNPVRILPTEC